MIPENPLFFGAFFTLLICLVSSGHSTYPTRINSDSNPDLSTTHSDSIYVLFGGEKFDFDYHSLGLVETQVKESASLNSIVQKLYKKAINRGANAIVNVDTEFVETGYADREALYNNEMKVLRVAKD
ncbi:MAG: hypothetical protein ACI9YL_000601 [Luteibaculaceae bacterium]|jgi:hypothetical protein